MSCSRPRLLSFALAAACLAPAATARAQDGPPPRQGMPQPLKKIEHPFLDGLVGSWDVTATSGANPAPQKGGSRFAKAVEGTALVEDLRVGEGASSFYGFGVLRLGDDGSSVRLWWYDTMGKGQVWPFAGKLTDTGYDLTGDMGGTPATVAFHKKGDGLEFVMKAGDKVVATSTYAKAAKEMPWNRDLKPTGKEPPMVQAMVGEWTIAGAGAGGRTYEGAATFSLALGGACLLGDSLVQMGLGPRAGLAVIAIPADGKSLKSWTFGNYFPEPTVMEGPLTDTSWEAQGKTPFGPVKRTTKKTETGLEAKTFVGDRESGTETLTRKK